MDATMRPPAEPGALPDVADAAPPDGETPRTLRPTEPSHTWGGAIESGSGQINQPTPPSRAAASIPTFSLLRVIGEGGMGEVFEAVQLSLGRTVAVKRLHAELVLSPQERDEAITAFRQEARMAARLEHPNIVPVHDLGSDGEGRPLLAMKLVEGKPWNELLRDEWHRLTTTEYLARHLPTLIQVGNAVAFAHSRGIVHRDLKPAQVLVGSFGEVLLSDWGLALHIPEVQATLRDTPLGVDLPTRETATAPSGTPALMAPEQTESTALRVGPWTDVYLLGATLYYLLTGDYPHAAPNARAAFEHAARGTVVPPEDAVVDRLVPTELARLAMQCMAKDPMDRPASALQVVQDLEAYLTGAGRRTESLEISDRIARRLDGSPLSDYSEYGDIFFQLEHALALWPNNDEAADLRKEALSQLGEVALKRGDLALAETQATALDQLEVSHTLRERIAALRAQRARRDRQRRLAIRVAIGLLLLVIIGGGAFTWSLHRARASAVVARTDAENQRTISAERLEATRGLVDRMLNALDEGGARVADANGQPIDESQAMRDEIVRAAFDFYMSIDSQAFPPQMREAQARQLARVGRTIGNLGYAEEGLMLLERAHATAQTTGSSKLVATLDMDVAMRMAAAGNLAGAVDRARAARTAIQTAFGADSTEARDADNTFQTLSRRAASATPLPESTPVIELSPPASD